jgi:hypothetical protein
MAPRGTRLGLFAAFLSIGATVGIAQSGGPGGVLDQTLIEIQPDYTQAISAASLASIGDLDGDGVQELAGADNNANETVIVLFMNADGTVKGETDFGIGGQGGFGGQLEIGDQFGRRLAPLGDLDGDGIADLACGAYGDDDGSAQRGAVWIVFLNPDGTVKAEQKISQTQGNFGGQLRPGDSFGASVAALGDLDGDGVTDLAVGASYNDISSTDLNENQGAVWIVFLNTDGTVKTQYELSAGHPLFAGALTDGDTLGSAAAGLGDLDGDGIEDLAVGADNTSSGASTRTGEAFVIFLNANGTPKSIVRIAEGAGGFTGDLDLDDDFGYSMASVPDLDGDGVGELAIGAPLDDDGGTDRGALWLCFLRADGSIKSHVKVGPDQGGFTGKYCTDPLPYVVAFGECTAPVQDYNGDGVADLGVGCFVPSLIGGFCAGAIYLLHVDDGEVAWSFPYGSGVNPADSLVSLGSRPSLGAMVTLGIDNPLGTQAAGSVPYLFLSLAPDPSFPNGTSIPNFGMSGPGASGELLIGLGAGDLVLASVGPSWIGPGMPVAFDVSVPNDGALLGLHVFAQGILIDPSAPPSAGKFGLTSGIDMRIGA